MTVYLVERCYDYEGCDLRGVFSTRELADAFLLKEKMYEEDDSLSVTAWEVDGMVSTSAKDGT